MKTKLEAPILIGEKYKVTSDAYQFILHTHHWATDKETKQLKEAWTQTYYPTWEQVAKAVCTKELKASEAEDLKALTKAFEDSVEKLTNAITEVVNG